MPSPPQQPAVTLTADLQNLTRSSLGASEYSLSVSSRLLMPFMRYCCNNIRPDERTIPKHNVFVDTVGWHRHNKKGSTQSKQSSRISKTSTVTLTSVLTFVTCAVKPDNVHLLLSNDMFRCKRTVSSPYRNTRHYRQVANL